jgi:hypothetical protein
LILILTYAQVVVWVSAYGFTDFFPDWLQAFGAQIHANSITDALVKVAVNFQDVGEHVIVSFFVQSSTTFIAMDKKRFLNFVGWPID